MGMGCLIPAMIAAQTWASYGKFPPPVAPYTNAPLPTGMAELKIIFPVVGQVDWRNNYNEGRGSFRHTGVDIRAKKMTPVVAPFDGVFGKKVNSFWVYGDNGWKCLGTHLNNDSPGTNDNQSDPDYMFSPVLRHGDRVKAGQLVGYVGDSGKATGPHLHFELYSGKGLRNPTKALQGGMKLITPLSEIPRQEDKPDPKQERFEVCKRNWVAETGAFYGVLHAKQFDTGRVLINTVPRFVTFKFSKELINLTDPAAWPNDRSASIYFAREGEEVRIVKVVPPAD
jgi:hypothetical protein